MKPNWTVVLAALFFIALIVGLTSPNLEGVARIALWIVCGGFYAGILINSLFRKNKRKRAI